MSYEIIKHIKVTEDKVLINCASNNVYPKTFEYCESKSLGKILQEQGREALDIEILKQYESGIFQRGKNRYTSALLRLKHMPEYRKFDWRQTGVAYEIANKLRDTDAFPAILREALRAKLPKDRFIMARPHGNSVMYLWKVTKRYAKWTTKIENAKEFYYKEDAERLIWEFRGERSWKVIKVK